MDLNSVDSSSNQFYISVKNFQDLMNILNVGDVVKGRVMENNGSGMYLINFLGHELTSKSSHSFAKGDVIYGKVMGMDDTLNLQLLQGNTGSPLDIVGSGAGEAFLKDSQLDFSPKNLSIVHQLQEQGIDMNKGNFNLLLETSNKLGLSASADIKAMAFLEANNMPLHEDIIKSLSLYMSDKGGVGANLKNVLSQLNENFASTRDIHINDMVSAIRNVLTDASSLDDKGVMDLLRNSGLMHENKIKNALLENAELLSKAQPQNINSELATILKDGKFIFDNLSRTGNLDLARLSKDISGVLGQDMNLKEMPKLITNIVAAADMAGDKVLGDYLGRLSSYFSGSEDKAGLLFNELSSLNDKFTDLIENGNFPRETVAMLMRSMKYFLYSGNTGALDKMHSMFAGIEDKQANAFAQELQNVKNIFDDFLHEQKNHTENMQLQKNEFMRSLNTAEDLKGVLLKANEYFSEQLKNNPDFFKENSFDKTMQALDRAIGTLQGEQIFNAKPSADYTYVSWQLPLTPESDIQGGKIEMFFKKDKEGNGKQEKGEQDDFKIAFLLDMTALGPVKIITDVKDRAINCQIMVTNEKVKEVFDANLPELKKDFERLNYDIGNMHCILDQRVQFEANAPVLEDANLLAVRKVNILV